MRKAYKYRGGRDVFDKNGQSVFERDVMTIVNNQIYLPTKNTLNDPTEGLYNDIPLRTFLDGFSKYTHEVEEQYDNFVKKMGSIGIYSLSKAYDNELLWAYYASGHTGFAIEFDLDILEKSLNINGYSKTFHEFCVEYLEECPKIDLSIFMKRKSNEILKRHIGTKSSSWRHEEELRLIFDNVGLFEIDYRAVTAVYFGARMPESDIDYIMDKLKGRGLRYYKIASMRDSYQFEAVPIIDKFYDAPQYVANNIFYDIDKLLLGGLTDDEIRSYKPFFIKAVDMICEEPLIKEFYMATITYEQEPILKIFGYTKLPLSPVKSFEFKISDEGAVIRIK